MHTKVVLVRCVERADWHRDRAHLQAKLATEESKVRQLEEMLAKYEEFQGKKDKKDTKEEAGQTQPQSSKLDPDGITTNNTSSSGAEAGDSSSLPDQHHTNGLPRPQSS